MSTLIGCSTVWLKLAKLDWLGGVLGVSVWFLLTKGKVRLARLCGLSMRVVTSSITLFQSLSISTAQWYVKVILIIDLFKWHTLRLWKEKWWISVLGIHSPSEMRHSIWPWDLDNVPPVLHHLREAEADALVTPACGRTLLLNHEAYSLQGPLKQVPS